MCTSINFDLQFSAVFIKLLFPHVIFLHPLLHFPFDFALLLGFEVGVVAEVFEVQFALLLFPLLLYYFY
jgi:hypothetical protein